MIIKNLVRLKQVGTITTAPPPIVWLKGNVGINAGTPVDGDAVYQWQDQSGNGNHFVQATAIRQPEYKASLINGLPGVFVDGTTFLELLSTVLFSNISRKGTGRLIGSSSLSSWLKVDWLGITKSVNFTALNSALHRSAFEIETAFVTTLSLMMYSKS